MRNALRFSKLTLMESRPEDEEDSAAYIASQPETETAPGADAGESRLFFVLLTVSISCAAASVATGSYAVWLARQQAARQALTDVNDILRSCHSRMSELESVLQRLPNRQA